ncbi:hypothetical protein [Adhaeribacter aerolatus]|uniref:hypothetical protein n=1 Tax=Adhaeribacter aerolatus TaxID=670289 RepID=UPI0011BF8F5D|nr:hypothetical protein [Adhaeribacter aerolatus]
MNQFKLSLAAPLFIMLATTVLSCNQNEKTKGDPTATSSTSPINGAWETVSPDGKITEFKMYHDGHFSFLMPDSSGKWSKQESAVTLLMETPIRKHSVTAAFLPM